MYRRQGHRPVQTPGARADGATSGHHPGADDPRAGPIRVDLVRAGKGGQVPARLDGGGAGADRPFPCGAFPLWSSLPSLCGYTDCTDCKVLELSMADLLKSELRNTWELAAPGWAKWEDMFSAGLADATDALLDMAAVEPGMRVLDVACGAGNQTIRAAKRVGPTGKVVASDISATMLDHVRQSAAKAAVPNIDTLACAADELDNRLAPFDAAISRLGLTDLRQLGAGCGA